MSSKLTPLRFMRLQWSIRLIIIASVISTTFYFQHQAMAAPVNPVLAAWAQAQASGAYHFASDVTQVTTPLATLQNVGRSSQQTNLHLEGETNLHAATMNLHLWSQDGSVNQPDSGVEVRVVNGKTQIRQNRGEWKEAGDVLGGVAPTGDFMTFLAGMRDIKELGTENRAGITFTRYSFQLDGPRIANYVRDQMETTLRQRGELPPGMELQAPTSYAQMQGAGELWIDHAGLPLRQTLDIQFPAQREERVAAHIVTDFTHFAAPQAALHLDVDQVKTLALSTFGSLLGLAFSTLVIAGRRSRRLYLALVSALIFATVAGPLLQNWRISSYLDVQTARAAEQEKQQSEQTAIHTARELASKQTFDPHADPLAVANARNQAEAQAAGNDPLPLPPAPTPEPLTALNNGVDTDRDGLTDFVEERIGTSAVISDTDGDLVSDGVEVKGFSYAGQRWFGDPLQRDSNNDGQADTIEWLNDANRDNLPDDADSDGIPDAFDNDNDGDGVPDLQDLSPYAQLRPDGPNAFFTEKTPLRYQVAHLQTNSPTFVDFQLRPSRDTHLWYALNVLDWPQDTEGQIQDGDGKTFADLPGRNAQFSPSDANGDLKLIPMLEIRVPTGSANLAPASDLLAYNVAVNNLAADGAIKVLYAPLRLTHDDKTGARVAFSARIPQWAVGPWEQPYEVRLVWVVQALIDFCDQVVDGLCTHYKVQNQPQVIQTYYDEWFLTGLTVREEHGSELAVIYEDPAVDSDLKDDGNLFLLSHGLDASFLAGRDQNHDQQRDLSVAEIARRFDRASNGAVSEEERWAIPNTLRAESKAYDTLDRALMTTAMTETKRILDANFAGGWREDNTRKPLLMFAYETRYRSQGLDALNGNGANNGYAHQHNGLLLVDLAPTGLPSTPLIVNAGLKWTLYCSAPASAPSWEACEANTIWEEVANRYADKVAQPGDDPETVLGRVGLMRFYFLALAQGVNNVVQQDNNILVPETGFKTDQGLIATIRSIVKGVGSVAAVLVNIATLTDELTNNLKSKIFIRAVAWAGERSVKDQLSRQGATGLIKTKITALWKKSKTTVVVGVVIVAVIALGVFATLGFFKFSGNPVLQKVVGGAILIAVILLSLYSLIDVITATVQVVQGLRAVATTTVAAATVISSTLRGSSALAGTSRLAGAVGAVIQIGIVWGFFIYQMVDSKTTVFSPQFNGALAQAIAATILIITLAVLGATVVGLIIVGVIAVIDAILTAICELGVDDLRKVPGLNGACFTLNTGATAGIAKLLYSFDTMVDTENPRLVVPDGLAFSLTNPARGLVANNPLTLTLGITTTVEHKDPKPENWMHILPYIWLFDEDNLRGTTFKYELAQTSNNLDAERHQMDNAWSMSEREHKFIGKTMYRAQAYSKPTIQNINLSAGINQVPSLYFNTGYALPAYECWAIPNPLGPTLFPPIPVCYTRTLDGHNSTVIDQYKFDILPPTLDQFMALTDSGDGGLKLKWDARFPTLADADGDGLRSSARQGNDPNDMLWDADGDGLSDNYELQWRSQGVPISPVSPDTDGDGLPDVQELQLGTNPVLQDTDNDGLKDGDEIYHQVYQPDSTTGAWTLSNTWAGGWTVAITGTQPINIIVSSDPTSPDSDGDGISDQAEKELTLNANPSLRLDPDGRPYHPLIVNKNPLLVRVAVNDADRIVKPGQAVVYNTNVTNLGAPFVAGGLEVRAPDALGAPFSTYHLELDQTNNVTKTTNFVVAHGPSQNVNINSFARARLLNTNPVTWTWQSVIASTLGGFSTDRPAWHTTVAPASFSRQDSYAVAALNHSATQDPNWHYEQLFPGQIGAWSFPAGGNLTLGVDQLHDASPSDIACNAFDHCFVVWSQYDVVAWHSVIMGRLTNQALQPVGAEFVVAADGRPDNYDHYFHPVVATDGTNFLVAYEGVQQRQTKPDQKYIMSSQINARWFNANGQAISLNATQLAFADVTLPLANPMRISYLHLDVAWVGDAYRVAWSQPKPGQPNNRLQVADFTIKNGAFTAENQHVVAENVTNAAMQSPNLAYDPFSGRILLATRNQDNTPLEILFQNRNDNQGRLLQNITSTISNIAVAYHPGIRGWFILWMPSVPTKDLHYFLLNADGSLVKELAYQPAQWVQTPSPVSSLACPAPESQPVLALPFEELPGATSFADASGWNANATCAGDSCPLAGVDGAPGAPLSDYGVHFNGAQKLTVSVPGLSGYRFSVAFWLKTKATTGGDFALLTGDNWKLILREGKLVYNSNAGLPNPGDLPSDSEKAIADDKWHHIVLVQNEFTLAPNAATAQIYVDGANTTRPNRITGNINAPSNLTIGGFANNTGFLTGEIDHLLVYNTALDQATVQAIMNRSQNSYCLATSPASNQASNVVNTVKLGPIAQDTRGGVIKSSAGLSLTVDADPPTSSVTSLVDGGYIQGLPGSDQTLIIGGSANDAYGIQQVNVQVNNGGFQPATGGATWVYPLQVHEGRYVIQSQALDMAGNSESAPRTTTVIVDASAPEVTTAFANHATLQPQSLPNQQWQVTLEGTVNDPTIGGDPGSGVRQVEVLLQSADLNTTGNGWQTANLVNGDWQLNYALPSAPALSGFYTVTVRTTDRVGNLTTLVQPVYLDQAGPTAALSNLDATRAILVSPNSGEVNSSRTGTQPLTIQGVANDPNGVNGVGVAFVPIQRMRALSDTLLFLSLDEPINAVTYYDRSPLHGNGSCLLPCVAGEPGPGGRPTDKAVRLLINEAGPIERHQAGEFEFTATTNFSLQSWLRTSQSNGVILSQEDAAQTGYALLLQGGKVALRLNGVNVAQTETLVNDNQWHQIVGVVEGETGRVLIYVDGTLSTQNTFTSTPFNWNGSHPSLLIGAQHEAQGIGGQIEGWFAEVGVFKAALPPFLVQALYKNVGSGWAPATVSPSGAVSTTWTMAVPDGLEGQYQIDLRTTDALGNYAQQGAAWRGTIDNLAPRLHFTATATGGQFTDGNGVTQFEIAYTYSAEDRNLNDATLSGPCSGHSSVVRGFAANADLAGLFPDLTLRNELSTSCNVWETSPTPATTISACDIYNQCATANATQSDATLVASSANLDAVDANAPSALLLAPANQSMVALRADNVLTVTFSAKAEQTLRNVVILLDNTPVQTIDFAQADALKTVQRTVNVTLVNINLDQFEGVHTLTAKASDWAGNEQQTLFPVNVTVDTHDPTIVLENDKLTDADGYALGNNMVRLHGASNDTLGLSAVQISVNGAPFQDVTFDKTGRWYTALWLDDEPAGQIYQFTVHASDRAGRMVEARKELLVDKKPRAFLRTTIKSGPTKSTKETSATFTFSGVDTRDGTAPNFQCQLDGGDFTPCTSPTTYNELRAGDHIFRVMSDDGKGTIDPTPAEWSWTTNPNLPLQTIYLPLVLHNDAGASEDTPVVQEESTKLYLPLIHN